MITELSGISLICFLKLIGGEPRESLRQRKEKHSGGRGLVNKSSGWCSELNNLNVSSLKFMISNKTPNEVYI